MDKLEEIFQRIHDNVYSRSLLSDQTKLPSEDSHPTGPLVLPPFPPDLLERIAALRNARAPYYVVSGNPLVRLLKRLHNLVIKLFGRKQAYYNHLTLDLLESMTTYLQAVQEHNKTQSSRIEALVSQVTYQAAQLAALQADHEKLVSAIEQIAPKRDEAPDVKEPRNQPDSPQHENQ